MNYKSKHLIHVCVYIFHKTMLSSSAFDVEFTLIYILYASVRLMTSYSFLKKKNLTNYMAVEGFVDINWKILSHWFIF